MSSYLTGIDTTIHPEDEMLLNAIAGLKSEGLARAVYFRQGYEINATLQTVLEWLRGTTKRQAKVLDFACGYGRATRFLVSEVDPKNVWASDIYAGAVEFQCSQFGVNGFVSCYEPSQLECDVKFDLIFVASLFTHLPRPRFEQWLARLFEMLSPTGVLAFSVHDETLVSGRTIPPEGFLFVRSSESRTLDLDEYGATYVTETFVAGAVHRLAGEDWHYKRIPLGLCGSHDVYLLSRDSREDFATLSYVQPPVGYVDWFEISPTGELRIGGWAGEHDIRYSVANIAISIDGELLANIKPNLERPDVVRVLGKEHFLMSGWNFSKSSLPVTEHGSEVIEVVLASTTGKTAILHSSLLSDASVGSNSSHASPKGFFSRIRAALRVLREDSPTT